MVSYRPPCEWVLSHINLRDILSHLHAVDTLGTTCIWSIWSRLYSHLHTCKPMAVMLHKSMQYHSTALTPVW